MNHFHSGGFIKSLRLLACKVLSKSQSMSSACRPVSFMLERRGLYVAVRFKSLWVGDRGMSFLAFRRGPHWSAVG